MVRQLVTKKTPKKSSKSKAISKKPPKKTSCCSNYPPASSKKTSKIQSKVSPTDKNVKVIDQVPDWRIPESLFSINNTNLLDALIFPMTKKQFLETIYSKKALVIRNQPDGRLDEIIEEQMYNLDVESLLMEQTIE